MASQSINAVIVFSIAIVLALLAGAMNAAVYRIHSYNMMLVDFVMGPRRAIPHKRPPDSWSTSYSPWPHHYRSPPDHVGPPSGQLGPPKLKSFLNGTYVRGGIFAQDIVCEGDRDHPRSRIWVATR